MRFLLAVSFIILINLPARPQSLSKLSVGGGLHAIATYAYNTTSSHDKVNTYQTYSQYADSVSGLETWRVSLGASVWANYLLNKKWTLQGGISYADLGFQRRQENIQYRDLLFPGIGRGILLENSSGGGAKIIEYNYRYKYIQVPLMVNYNVYASRDFHYFGYLTAGLGLNFLVDHCITANLYQFVVDGKKSFTLDSTGYEGNRITCSVFIGAKGEYRIDKQLTFFVQPVFGFSPISASAGKIQSYPVYLQLNTGLQYAINFFDDKGR